MLRVLASWPQSCKCWCLSLLRCAERRVAGLRKQIEELRLALDAANAELQGTKLHRETSEQELKGYEVELAVNESAVQTLEVLYCRY